MKCTSHLPQLSSEPVLSPEAWNQFKSTIQNPEIGFFRIKEISTAPAKAIYQEFKNKKSFVHVGIGGSYLGPEMLIEALGTSSTEFTFISNIDSDDIEKRLSKVDLKDSLFYIVSKSGSTAETMAALMIICSQLKKIGIDESKWKNSIVVCTDPNKGDLYQFATQFNCKKLVVPLNIGGRYSVLSDVGFLPALFAGIDIDQLMQGALTIQKEILETNELKSQAAAICTLYEQHGVNQTVLLPYSSLLKNFSHWFVQLWAESLGKEGKGLTPIPGFGATDQHSQMQLFMEGPKDKLVYFVNIEKRQKDFKLDAPLELKSFNQLNLKSLNQLMKAELEGTLKAFREAKKPYYLVNLTELSAFEMGQMILWFESLTVLVGHALKVDPFNQPGVEKGKVYAYEFLRNL